MAPAPAAALAHHKRRPAPDAVAGEDDRRRGLPGEAAGNKKSRFYYEKSKKMKTLNNEPHNNTLNEPHNNNNVLLHVGTHDHEDDYETVEEDYEFDDINDYEILQDDDFFSFQGPPSSSAGSGLVRARDRCTGETVAIRRVHVLPCTTTAADDDSSLLLCAAVPEATCLAACRGHPSVLQLKTLAAADETTTGDLFVVTEAPPAGATTLRTHLRRRRRGFSEAEARALMRRLLRAAAMMHGAGVTHRDISPDNILVSPSNGVLKMSGFGCATMKQTHSSARHVGGDEEPPPPMGSMRYRSPEQLYGVVGGGVRSHGPEGDMWALGCVMAEVLLAGGGAPLFAAAETAAEVLERAIELRDEIVTMGVEAFDDVLGQTGVLSVAGRELLAGLLEFDDWERVTAADALRHRWFNEEDDDVEAKS